MEAPLPSSRGKTGLRQDTDMNRSVFRVASGVCGRRKNVECATTDGHFSANLHPSGHSTPNGTGSSSPVLLPPETRGVCNTKSSTSSHVKQMSIVASGVRGGDRYISSLSPTSPASASPGLHRLSPAAASMELIDELQLRDPHSLKYTPMAHFATFQCRVWSFIRGEFLGKEV